jgi:nitroreductase
MEKGFGGKRRNPQKFIQRRLLMELQSALENRKSIRSYLSKDVEPEKLTALIEAASLAPSWKNSQTARYYVIHTPEKLEQIRATLPEFNRKNCEQAPALIITTVVLNRSGYERNGEPTNELGNGWGFYDCGLGSMALLLKATELGLSTLVMGIRDAAKIREILEIPENEAVVSVISVGYSDADPERPARKPLEKLARFF